MPHPFILSPPPAVLAILERLAAAGFVAHVVGGCVRDALLGHTPADWDICTSATPTEVKSCFSDARVVNTGIAHGTLTLLLAQADCPTFATTAAYEITTYRTESTYSDHRHPDYVSFTRSLPDDLARRDFTINAMAFAPKDGLIDLHGGQADLAARMIRCVGEPTQRFAEDGLRILRALRFAAVLGFSLDPETARAAFSARDTLRFVSPERVYTELTKLLCAPHAAAVLRAHASILYAVLPLLAPMHGFAQNSPYHDKDVWLHTVAAVNAAPADAITRWALLLHDSGKPNSYTQDVAGVGHFRGHASLSEAIARDTLTTLRAETATLTSVQRLVRWHDVPLQATAACASRWLRRLGESDLHRLLDVKRADTAAHAQGMACERAAETDAFACFLKEALAKQLCLSVHNLAINGNDILACGVPFGARVGVVQRKLLDRVLAGNLENAREALLAEVLSEG